MDACAGGQASLGVVEQEVVGILGPALPVELSTAGTDTQGRGGGGSDAACGGGRANASWA